MRGRAGSVVLAGALLLGACAGDDGGDAADEDADAGAAAMPEECPSGDTVTLPFEGGEALPGIDGDEFEATSVVILQQPIVPDAGGGYSTFEEYATAAAATDLLAYGIYLADYDIDEDAIGVLGLTEPPPDGTYVNLTVVPPTEEPLATGDVVEAGIPDFDSVTSFATIGLSYQSGLTDAPPLLAGDVEGDATVEVLHLDDERLCLRWSQGGTLLGTTGEWSVEGVVAGELGPRANQPLT